jgi:hypothetical protein
MAAPEVEIPTLRLHTQRRILGYLVPLISFPILTWKAYSLSLIIVQPNLQLNNPDLINDLVTISFSLVLLFLIPQHSPLYTNRYWLTTKGLKITRILKGTKTLSYDTIERLELYIRDERKGKPSKEALQYARDHVNEARKNGFKFIDYTNNETKIALIYCGNKIYMITPANPRVFTQNLIKRVKRLSVKTFTLTPKGTRVKEGAP